MATSLWRNRGLVKALVQREVIGRYRGSVMGILWSFLNPVFMLLVFTFVFSVVFKARWGTGSDYKQNSPSCYSPDCSFTTCFQNASVGRRA